MPREFTPSFSAEPRLDDEMRERIKVIELEKAIEDIGEAASSSEFLSITEFDDTDATFYFYGGVDNDSNWKIVRYDKATLLSKSAANEVGNPTKTSLALAWPDRLTLSYS